MTDGNGGEPIKDPVGELAQEIRRVIDDNRMFLERVMDDEFEDEEDPDEAEMPKEEL